MPFLKFICTECGHLDAPCHHWLEHRGSPELHELHGLRKLLVKIISILTVPARATLRIGGLMPATIEQGKTASSTFKEFTQSGAEIPNAGPIAFSSSDSNIATVDGSGLCSGLNPGDVTISGRDTVNGLSASDLLTVTVTVPVPPPDTATSATLTLTAN
jgi:hypothetical protein